MAHDVVIIGGGLAGLSLSILLRREGLGVLVLEKDNYPRHKVCGEYISMESWPFLEQLGLPLEEMQLPRITRLEVTDVRGKGLTMDLPLGGFGISRYALDGGLAELARDAGIQLRTHCKVSAVHRHDNIFRVEAGDKNFTAPLVCGAWGKRSNMDVRLARKFTKGERAALDNFVGIKHHLRADFPDDLISLHNFDGGYCGVVRVERGVTCACYLTTAATLRAHSGDIAAVESAVLARNPALARIFSSAEKLYEAPLAISQVSFSQKEAVLDGVLMVGDTAGLIAPLCGNGMSMAFRGAKLAADCAIGFLSGELSRTLMEQKYASGWKRLFATRLAVGRAVQARFGNPSATSNFLRVMKALPFLQKPLVRATHGRPFA